MPKRVQSNRERAIEQYLNAEEFEKRPECVAAFDSMLNDTMLLMTMKRWDAVVTIRDYAQLILADIQDQRMAATQQEIERLEKSLHK